MCDVVVGLGEVGRPLTDVLRMTRQVFARDLESLEGEPPTGGVLHICFPFSESFTGSVLRYCDEYKPALAIVHSTVAPGTTREVAKRFPRVAYSPVRGRHAEMHRDLLRYCKFVSAPDEAVQVNAAAALAERGFSVRTTAPVEGLELTKLLETTYSGLLIAWAQEMARYCEAVGAEFGEALRFTAEVSYLPRHAFHPGHIGGHCIVPNLDLLDAVRPSPFTDAIRASNEAAHPNGERHRPRRLRDED